MIRAMIVDDALVRLSLADLLDSDPEIDLVAQAADGLQAIEQAGARRIDVALVDVRMPRMNGITATARLRALPHRGRTDERAETVSAAKPTPPAARSAHPARAWRGGTNTASSVRIAPVRTWRPRRSQGCP
jgi:CheY-like chemotaxis protein